MLKELKYNEKIAALVVVFLIGISIGVISSFIVFQESGKSYLNLYCISNSKIIPVFDRDFYPVVMKALKNANESIEIIAFKLSYYPKYRNSKENKLVWELIKARERGVKVRILLDEYPNKNSAYSLLKSRGIDIKYDSKNVTTHAKVIIIDGKIVILGSTNFSYYGLEKNHEANIYIESEEVAKAFRDYFEKLWKNS
ncbi:MAG TPA: hypothetical protein ENG50_04850 [Candidatus Altiarchaeales archaeon]|nr:hypothetical protein [Candidatus Altiarchaeales archaeon]